MSIFRTDATPTSAPSPQPANEQPYQPPAIYAAIAECNGAVIVHNRKNTHTGTDYADLQVVCDTLLPILARHRVVVLPTVAASADGGLGVTTTLLCTADGSAVSTTVPIKPAKTDAQSVGSALTYGRRYGLVLLTGAVVAADDDDGHRASKDPTGNRRQAPKSLVDDVELMKAINTAKKSLAAWSGLTDKNSLLLAWKAVAKECGGPISTIERAEKALDMLSELQRRKVNAADWLSTR